MSLKAMWAWFPKVVSHPWESPRGASGTGGSVQAVAVGVGVALPGVVHESRSPRGCLLTILASNLYLFTISPVLVLTLGLTLTFQKIQRRITAPQEIVWHNFHPLMNLVVAKFIDR